MNPDLYLLVERVRAQELRAAAQSRRRTDRTGRTGRTGRTARTGPPRRPHPGTLARAWERRLGWALVETGLRLVSRGTTRQTPRLTADHHA
ncbi:hypothetical protein [Nonomuraea sp. NPDC001831]|uniref:hypothetical protein n=1 Tax=Nonomuraea sp. NPDC001831 TaxID=3364340 RepID=UPI00368ED92A